MVESYSQNYNDHLLKRKPYYLAQFDDSGVLEHANMTDQFIVEINSEVRFKLRSGSSVSNQACLLINKPLVLEDSTLQYTVTQPRVHLKQVGTLDEDDDNYLTEEFRQREFRGSDLDADYLERVEPYQMDGKGSLNLEFRVMFRETGSFFVQLEYFDESINHINYSQPQYINVEPILVLQGQQVKCKQLSIITVLSRCLGPLDRWSQVLQNASQLGYNAVHFTPIQQYGSSYSHYSLQDQTLIADCFFEDGQNASQRERSKLLLDQITRIRNEHRLLSVIDIVLNHTANNSPWLYDNPESGYNTDNCPHLYSAFVLDRALSDFSDRYANKQVPECPAAPYISNEADLQKVMCMIREKIIPGLKLHEYFQCNINEQIQQVEAYYKQASSAGAGSFDIGGDEFILTKIKKDLLVNKSPNQLNLTSLVIEQLTQGHGSGPQPFSVKLKMPQAALYFYELSNHNISQAVQRLKDALGQHNGHWLSKVQEFMTEAVGGIEGTIRYYKVELKRSLITTHAPPQNYQKKGPAEYEGNQIVTRYFTELNNNEQSKLAHNGWIMNADPLRDFALEGWHYLRRTINIWGDSVKLRYGNCPADSPFLWKHMSDYVTEMAQIFDGFRLDNAHSTPIHVCQYLLQVARTQNINLYVMAELFTSSAEADAYFVRKLNLNGLVREIQSTHNGRNLGEYFHKRTCQEAVLGRIDREFEDISADGGSGGITGQTYEVLKPTKPSDIIYDTTHDNPTMLQKFKTSRIALSMIGLISLGDQAIATTWGYDQLIPRNLNVVTEDRFYEVTNHNDLYNFDGKDIKSVGAPHKQYSKINGDRDLNGSIEQSQKEVNKLKNFEYEFVFKHGSARNIQLAGEFTGWQPNYQMNRDPGSDHWKLKLDLPILPNLNGYQFKFVVDGQWSLNSDLPKMKDKGGNDNNYVSFPGKKNNQEKKIFNPSSASAVFKDLSYARWKLNQFHEECTMHNAEIFMHQQSDDVIVVVRQFELDYQDTYDAYVSITRSCYYQEGGEYKYQTEIELPGLVSEVVLAGYLEINNSNAYHNFYEDKNLVKGADASFRVFKGLDKFCQIQKLPNGQKDQLIFHEMPPGFTCILKTKCPDNMKEAIKQLNYLQKLEISSLSRQFFKDAPYSALNHVLFRCDPEEKDISKGARGPYGLSKYGQFVYAGITSVMHLLRKLKVSGDMGHELFDNIRQGDWLLEYTINRLSFMEEELKSLISFLKEYQLHIQCLNPTYKPKMVARIIEKVYNAAVYNVVNIRIQDEFINDTSDIFLQKLALSSAQMYGRVPSAYFKEHKDTLCAGLPHFSTGYTRCWGRDTFIALRGLYTVLGLEEEARETILYFAKVMRHGLIPNLHDQGNNTRYNARDATWFFLQAIKDYIENSKEGVDILKERFELQFPEQGKPQTLTIEELIHTIIQAHASGIVFRERNAGDKIDAHMKSEGFDVRIVLDRETGFCVGGNRFNCGTWMDKMGSSEKTGNRGIPATPRDGAPIELVGLQYSVLTYFHKLHENDEYKYHTVELQDGSKLSYDNWAKKMKQFFEQCFWVPQEVSEDELYVIEKKYVHRRGIYKDTFQSYHKFTDYQLRPNICIAMACAPELFVPEHAQECLSVIERLLMTPGCMGIKTLDPGSDHYKGDYVNSDESNGWNYHQGPEWVWPVGYFLLAKLKFTPYESKDQAVQKMYGKAYLSQQIQMAIIALTHAQPKLGQSQLLLMQ